MSVRITFSVVIATLMITSPAWGQPPAAADVLSARYVDPIAGLTLEQAIARALDIEPALQGVRRQVDVAEGMRQQASLRPNPSLSLERREEMGGTDNLTTVGVQWPLDLFRRTRRVAVADREIESARLVVADNERLLAAEVRTRYGDVLAAVRDLGILDELVTIARRQRDLLRSRVDEGASAPLDRDVVDVELRRLESERLLHLGRTDAAVFQLKRVLGMAADERLTLRDTLEVIAGRETSTAAEIGQTGAAPEQRPDVREASARVEIAEAKIGRAQANGRWDASLFGSYMRMDAGFPQRAFANDGSLVPIHGLFDYVSGGVMVTLPLLSRNQGDVAAARAERAAAQSAYDAALLAAQTDAAEARVRDERARQAVQLYAEGTQALARATLSVISESYELGRVTVFDVLAGQRRYLDVERAYTAALREAYEARTALNRAAGGVR
jgi:cobalt-zinc-cadmium efflux system outer membrane protein